MTKLGSILNSRDVTLPTKVRLVKAMVFPVVMYGCEISWQQLPSTVIFQPPKIKSVTISIVSPSICYEVMGLNAMISVF